MKITYHAIYRYCERIVGISRRTDIEHFIKKNEWQIKYTLLTFFINSKYITKSYFSESYNK